MLTYHPQYPLLMNLSQTLQALSWEHFRGRFFKHLGPILKLGPKIKILIILFFQLEGRTCTQIQS